MYSFNIASHRKARFANDVREDIKRCRKLATDETRICSALIATHPGEQIAESFEGIVKYRTDINRALGQFGNAEVLRERASKEVKSNPNDLSLVACFGGLNPRAACCPR